MARKARSGVLAVTVSPERAAALAELYDPGTRDEIRKRFKTAEADEGITPCIHSQMDWTCLSCLWRQLERSEYVISDYRAALAAETARREEAEFDARCALPEAQQEITRLAAQVKQLREVLQEARQYVCDWPIGTSDESQEQRGGPRDTIIHNIYLALAAVLVEEAATLAEGGESGGSSNVQRPAYHEAPGRASEPPAASAGESTALSEPSNEGKAPTAVGQRSRPEQEGSLSAVEPADEETPLTADEWAREHATDMRVPAARAEYERYRAALSPRVPPPGGKT